MLLLGALLCFGCSKELEPSATIEKAPNAPPIAAKARATEEVVTEAPLPAIPAPMRGISAKIEAAANFAELHDGNGGLEMKQVAVEM